MTYPGQRVQVDVKVVPRSCITALELKLFQYTRSYTPRHNDKVERSHREGRKRFYSCLSFFSLLDLQKQLALHSRRSHNFPMRPLAWLSPFQFTVQFV